MSQPREEAGDGGERVDPLITENLEGSHAQTALRSGDALLLQQLQIYAGEFSAGLDAELKLKDELDKLSKAMEGRFRELTGIYQLQGRHVKQEVETAGQVSALFKRLDGLVRARGILLQSATADQWYKKFRALSRHLEKIAR